LSGPPSLPVGCTRPDCRARAPGRLMNSQLTDPDVLSTLRCCINRQPANLIARPHHTRCDCRKRVQPHRLHVHTHALLATSATRRRAALCATPGRVVLLAHCSQACCICEDTTSSSVEMQRIRQHCRLVQTGARRAAPISNCETVAESQRSTQGRERVDVKRHVLLLSERPAHERYRSPQNWAPHSVLIPAGSDRLARSLNEPPPCCLQP
jgi:hypothetical protein